jgi:hypothetical protein
MVAIMMTHQRYAVESRDDVQGKVTDVSGLAGRPLFHLSVFAPPQLILDAGAEVYDVIEDDKRAIMKTEVYRSSAEAVLQEFRAIASRLLASRRLNH